MPSPTLIPLNSGLTMTFIHDPRDPLTGAEIQAFRAKWGLTQAELAHRLGLKSGVVTISAWENDRSTSQSYLRLALAELARELQEERDRAADPMSEEIRRLESLLGDE